MKFSVALGACGCFLAVLACGDAAVSGKPLAARRSDAGAPHPTQRSDSGMAESRDAATARDSDVAHADADAAPPEDASSTLPDARAPAADAATPDAASSSPKAVCPLHVSLTTKSYGTGNNEDDDYAPNNVGAVWVTTPDGKFVRTIAVWGPGYWSFAETWVKQSNGSRVDIVAGATRKNHDKSVEADWDCRDKNLQSVPDGAYRLNVEFTEAEHQGPLLSGDTALQFEIGANAADVVREPNGSFGPITIHFSTP